MVRNTNLVMAARSAIVVGGSRIHRSIFTPVSVTRGLERDRTTGAAEPEYKSKRGYSVHAPKKVIAGHFIWNMTSMMPEKVQEILGPMTKEQLEVKIQRPTRYPNLQEPTGWIRERRFGPEREGNERESVEDQLRLIETEEVLLWPSRRRAARCPHGCATLLADWMAEGFRVLKEAVLSSKS